MGSAIHDSNTFSEVTRRFRTEYMTHRRGVTSASHVWRSGCPRSTRRECRRRRASAARAVTFWARTHRTKHAECLTPSLRTRARPKRARSSVSDESALGPLRAWAAGRCHTTVWSREVVFTNSWKGSARSSGTSATAGTSGGWSGGARGRLDAAQSASRGVAGGKVWQCGGGGSSPRRRVVRPHRAHRSSRAPNRPPKKRHRILFTPHRHSRSARPSPRPAGPGTATPRGRRGARRCG